jgi:SAM-dependent methyltransferase
MSQPPIEYAKNRAYELLEQSNAALERGEIDEKGWFLAGQAVITPAYMSADNPRAQSGHSGDEAHWTHARSLIADAVSRNGSFLDIGCASGYLMECMQRWLRQKGLEIEPYGLDIAAELADLARRRLPHWVDRIHVGNALYWQPQMRFDFVRIGLEYVPSARQKDLVQRLLLDVVAPGGHLIIGTYNEERDDTRVESSMEDTVSSWGFTVAGRAERTHYHDERLVYRVLWIDR